MRRCLLGTSPLFLPVATMQIGGVVMAFLFWRQTGAAAPNYRAFL
jgi:hypothetical protein